MARLQITTPWCSPVGIGPCRVHGRQFESGRSRHLRRILVGQVGGFESLRSLCWVGIQAVNGC